MIDIPFNQAKPNLNCYFAKAKEVSLSYNLSIVGD